VFCLPAQLAVAHPPTNPYDNTTFAPVRTGGVRIDLERVADGFVAPMKGITAPGHPGRLFVIDQVGRFVSLELATRRQSVVLNLSGRLVPLGTTGPGSFDERGFLGAAFHPGFARNGLLYTYTSEPVAGAPTFPTTLPAGVAPDHQNVVAEWRVGADLVVDPASRRELMRVDWPQFNHNGGDITFGPDGLLYIPMGDGGGADDEEVGHGKSNAQNPSNPLGDILRIDVNARDSANKQYGVPAGNVFAGMPGLIGEIYAWGFRNPWRLSFDRTTGKLYTGDVGQNDIEEVDVVVNGGNYGWPFKEGTLFFNPNGTNVGTASRRPFRDVPPGLQEPVAQYDTHHEGHSVIGGFVYHGKKIPKLRGKYVFAEWSRLFNSSPNTPNNYGRILYLNDERRHGLQQIVEVKGFPEAAVRAGVTDSGQPPAFYPQTLSVLGMAEDTQGELYIMGNIRGTPFGAAGVVLRLKAG
jgi:glucose/arabinose dehydrogenase